MSESTIDLNRSKQRYSSDLITTGDQNPTTPEVIGSSVSHDALTRSTTAEDIVCRELDKLFSVSSDDIAVNIEYVYSIHRLRQYGNQAMKHVVSGTMFEAAWRDLDCPLNAEIVVRQDDGSNLISSYVRFSSDHTYSEVFCATLHDQYIERVRNLINDRLTHVKDWSGIREFTLDQYKHLVMLLNYYLLNGSVVS